MRFGFGKGVVLIDTSLLCLKSVQNFHDENLVAFHLTSDYIQTNHRRDGCNHTQASGPKDQQAQAHGGHQAWQNLDLDS